MTAPYLAAIALIVPLHGQGVDSITFERAPRQVGQQFTETLISLEDSEEEYTRNIGSDW